jgi:hypothetical protein
MIQTTIRLLDEYGITFESRSRVFVDGVNPSFIRSRKERVDVDTNYVQQIAFCRKSHPSVYDRVLTTEYVCDSSSILEVSQGNVSTLQRDD